MDPPSYEEAGLHPPALSTEALNGPPPPSYDASFSSPSTPPPTYGEAVTALPDPFPVLTPLTGPTTETSPGITNVTPPVVVSQPQSGPTISVSHLRDVPAVVCCPHCQNVITTKVTHRPGSAAWCTCILLSLMGLVCGFCLIPLMMKSLQDVHHSCPQCGNHLHTFMK